MMTPFLRRLFLGCWLAAGPAVAQSKPPELAIAWGTKVAMRDGIELNANIYRPADQRDPLPVLLAMTPYIADTYHPLAKQLAASGYVAIVFDVRGRGASAGVFRPFEVDGHDSYDAIEWAAKQSWSNGKVGMIGGSYGGFNQWAAAKQRPPHLAAIAPVASGHPGLDFPSLGNIGALYQVQWLLFTSGKASNTRFFSDGEWWATQWKRLYREHLPFGSADSVAGNPTAIFQEWVSHPYPGEWSDRLIPGPDDYRQITMPILSRTGMYDDDQIGAMGFYRNHMRYGSAEAKARHYLVIGPWDHGGTRSPSRELGGLTFGPASLIDMGKLESAWYDWVFKGGPRPELLQQRVAYYVTGAEVWKYTDSLEAIGANPTSYYLTSPGNGAKGVYASGVATTTAGSSPPDTWVDDPLDLHPAEVESEDGNYVDQTGVVNLGGRGLIYHTAPFEQPTEISGFPTASLWLSLDVPDADFKVTLSEITREGRSILLDEAYLRARYRRSLRAPELVTPGAVERYDFTQFRFMSRQVAAGSRIRFVIESPNSPRLEKNYHSGGAVARETGKDARTAHPALHHEPGRASLFTLPIVR